LFVLVVVALVLLLVIVEVTVIPMLPKIVEAAAVIGVDR
jgi:hypothetical protein